MDTSIPNEAEATLETSPKPTVLLAHYLRYMPLVRTLARCFSRKLPRGVDFEDLVSAGAYGLVDALRKHDGDLDERFRAYATIRIRGSMIDEIRKQEWVSRRTRNVKVQSRLPTVVLFSDLGDEVFEVPANEANASDDLERTRRNARLRDAIAQLPLREAEIITRHYFDGVQLSEIAASLSVSSSRVSQLHARAIATLKGILTAQGEEDLAA